MCFALLVIAGFCSRQAQAQTAYVLTNDNRIATIALIDRSTISAGLAITGIPNNEVLVGIDMRPQNQRLYGLGVDAAANKATLYHITPETGIATQVGAAAGLIAFKDTLGNDIDLPDPSAVGYGFDFNPSVDRIRVVAGGLNFRANPNTGGPVDSDGIPGNNINPDGVINDDTTTVDATAYTNNQPNVTFTTQYTLDATSDSLYLQAPPNNGTQTLIAAVTLGGAPLNFTTINGFDIPTGVNAPGANMPVATGSGYALLNVAGTTGLYSIDLVTGAATLIGNVAGKALAVRNPVTAVVALASTGTDIVRFNPDTPGTTFSVSAAANLVAGEVLVGIDLRPNTGQFYALGVDALANTGTLYVIDPQPGTGAAAIIAVAGTASAITFAGEDFPDPATAGYGFDFNPTVDRIRVTTSTGLNFRISPVNGLPAAATTDGDINSGGITGVSATAYTNSFGQGSGGPTTQYTLDAASNSLSIQNPPNNGNQTQSKVVTLGGSPLDFTDISGFDIPSAVTVSTPSAVAAGHGWAALTVGGMTQLYRIDLTTGEAILQGGVGTPLTGLTIPSSQPDLAVESPIGTPIGDGVAEIDFGSVVVGQSATRTIKVRNVGNVTLTYAAATDDATHFDVTSNESGLVNSEAVIEVTFAPVATGPKVNVLRIVSNNPGDGSFAIDVKGFALLALTDDNVTLATGETRLSPLANDPLDSDDYFITAVSNPAIQITPDGRSLIIPANFGGSTFTYTVTDGITVGQGTVNVSAGTPAVAPLNFNGLLFTPDGATVGFATVTISAKGVATVKLLGGSAKASAKITLTAAPSSGAASTPLGYLVLDRNVNNTVDLTLFALGGNITGTLLPVVTTAAVEKYHIALVSPETTIPGGGYAIAAISNKGVVKITGLLPDGVPFSAASALRDNDTIALYAVPKGPKPPATVGGEVTLADLANTDVSGEIGWLKLPQLANVKGLHLSGVSTVLTANGSLFTGLDALPTGNGTLRLFGGNLAAPEMNAVIVNAAGIPAVPAGALKTWTGVKQKVGKFSATVTVPGITKPVKASGLYLPKINGAVGFFPGTTEGGRIVLTVP